MPPDASRRYVGEELDLFASATRWKTYLATEIRPYLGKEVLEVGAGLGATTRLLCTPAQIKWTALEPDPTLAARARHDVEREVLPRACDVRTGTLAALAPMERFDTILYIDVLEHIRDDAGEARRAVGHLRDGGFLVVLSPAHQWLFSPFDQAIGHYRRYNASTLRAVAPADLALVRLRYLDSVGLLASWANRGLLRQKMPTAGQVKAWDRLMVPASRVIDPLLAFNVGKSVLAVWRR